MAKVIAAKEGFHLVSSLLDENIIVEFDNLEIVQDSRNSCNIGELVRRSKIEGLFQRSALVWTLRQGNQAAHQVAKLALMDNLPFDWLVRRPQSLDLVLDRDKEAC